jgi:hypothetical protein
LQPLAIYVAWMVSPSTESMTCLLLCSGSEGTHFEMYYLDAERNSEMFWRALKLILFTVIRKMN